jgi:hypothetical protein
MENLAASKIPKTALRSAPLLCRNRRRSLPNAVIYSVDVCRQDCAELLSACPFVRVGIQLHYLTNVRTVGYLYVLLDHGR